MSVQDMPAEVRRRLKEWAKDAPKRAGRADFQKYISGRYCTQRELMRATCYFCAQGWPDGIAPCTVWGCPLATSTHPYRNAPVPSPDCTDPGLEDDTGNNAGDGIPETVTLPQGAVQAVVEGRP